MKLTPYNLHEAIEMLRGRALLYFMREAVLVDGDYGKPLWDLVSDMTTEEAEDAIRAFEATQSDD